MQVLSLRAILIAVALGECLWGIAFYFAPHAALGFVGRPVIDPVIARQYPLYLASGAIAYALAAIDPKRYSRVLWICVIQRAIEIVVACVDRHAGAISSNAFLWLLVIEGSVAVVSIAVLRTSGASDVRDARDPRDRGLMIALRCFGGLELFWFFASTIFVQVGSRLLNWKLQDPYTTQQMGIGLLVIGLVSLLVASDVARYRVLVWIPVFSQLIGVANSLNELRLGSIGLSAAAAQWTIEFAIVFCFAWFSRAFLASQQAIREKSA
jgi:hypothetical protein